MKTCRALSACSLGLIMALSLHAVAQGNAANKPMGPPPTNVSGHNSLDLPFGTRINVEISKELDTKRLKVGDLIEARVIEAVKINGNTMVPRNSTIRGHVTEATARSKKDASTALGLGFDDVVIKGAHYPTELLLFLVTAPEHSNSALSAPSSGMATPGTGASVQTAGRVGAGNAMSGISNADIGARSNNANLELSNPNNGQFQTAAGAVRGYDDMQLELPTGDAAQGVRLVSAGKDLRLESGTQFQLRALTKNESQNPN
jgi:hypothetical protein